LQPSKDLLGVEAGELFALFIHTAQTFLYHVVAAKNGSDRFDDGSCRCRDQQGGESTVIQVKLRRLRKRFTAVRESRCRQQYLFFHTDVAEQRSAKFRVSRWLNLFALVGGSLKSVFDSCMVLFQISRNRSCHF
jgi:hypothetical protein